MNQIDRQYYLLSSLFFFFTWEQDNLENMCESEGYIYKPCIIKTIKAKSYISHHYCRELHPVIYRTLVGGLTPQR